MKVFGTRWRLLTRLFRRPPNLYQHGGPRLACLLIGVLYAVLAVVLLILPPPSWWQALVVPVNLGLAACFFRWARIGVYLDKSGIRNLRMIRTIRIPWSRFDRFVLRQREGLDGFAFAQLVDGTYVWMQGVGPRSRLQFLNNGGEVDVVNAMNKEAARLKAGLLSTTP